MHLEGDFQISFQDLKIAGISGKDRLCSECGNPFKDGDKVVLVSMSDYNGDGLNLGFFDFVHALKDAGEGTCFEKFCARVANNLINPTELVVSDSPVVEE